MIVDWIRFATALVLLLTPIAVFHGKHVHYRPIRRDLDAHWSRILRLGLHAFDAARGALGGWLLVHALGGDPAAHGFFRHGAMLTQGAVLLAAVTAQTCFCREPDCSHAPFAFVAGLLFGFCPPVIAGFSLVLALAVAGGSRTPAAFFPTLSVAALALGVLLGGKALVVKLIFGLCAILLPWLYSLLFSRDLVISYRARRSSEDEF